jgi:membrane protein implicated in regulation of membrane protease activity
VTLTVALVLFAFGVTVDIIVARTFYRRVRSYLRARRPVDGLVGRIGEYRL